MEVSGPVVGTATLQIPEVDLKPIKDKITALEARVAALEAVPPPVPLPTPPPTPPPTTSPTDQIYSATSVWYKKLDATAPLHAKSAAYVGRFNWWRRNSVYGSGINAENYGCPLYVVTSGDPLRAVYNTTSGHASYPTTAELQAGINVPANIQSAGGTDGHVHLWNKSTDTSYSFWQFKNTGSRFECKAVGIIKSASQSDGTLAKMSYWNTARASHLPNGGGLITKLGLERGSLDTALIVAMPKCAKTAWVYPAKSTDGESGLNTDYDVNALPMGLRLRFPANITINSSWTPLTKMLVTAIRDYGMFIGDTTQGNSFALYAEDARQYGVTNILQPYLAGKSVYAVVGNKAADAEIPWSQCVVVT